MNEMYAAEPSFARTALELKLFLEKFGPTSGRYLAALPKEWRSGVTLAFSESRPIEQQRVMTQIRRARERAAVLYCPDFPWSDLLDWRTNASRLADPKAPRIKAAVVAADEDGPLPQGLIPADQLELDPTSEEEIITTPAEFTRVSSIIIGMKGDIHVVDPHLDPCRSDVRPLLAALLRKMASARVNSLTIWARAKLILDDRKHTQFELERALRNAGSGAGGRLPITLNLLRDDNGNERMHARYLFSIRGGIWSDQGFQLLPGKGKTKVGPMSSVMLDRLVRQYHEREGHAPIALSINVSL